MDTREEIEFIKHYGIGATTCDRCGKPTTDSGQYKEVLDGLYCPDCAEIVKDENAPEMYCDNCGFYFLDASDKCPKCGEVDSDVFYRLSGFGFNDYWEDGGELFENTSHKK